MADQNSPTPPQSEDGARDVAEAYRVALHQVRTVKAALRQAEDVLDSLLSSASEGALNALPDEPPIPDQVHFHKPGGISLLEKDPKQAAFVEARLGHMPYKKIADAAASFFGPDRAVKKSTVHKWHRRHDH